MHPVGIDEQRDGEAGRAWKIRGRRRKEKQGRRWRRREKEGGGGRRGRGSAREMKKERGGDTVARAGVGSWRG